MVSRSIKKKEEKNNDDDNAYSFTKLYSKPFKYEQSHNKKITEEHIDQVRERKLKDLEIKAAKEREKLEIVISFLSTLFMI